MYLRQRYVLLYLLPNVHQRLTHFVRRRSAMDACNPTLEARVGGSHTDGGKLPFGVEEEERLPGSPGEGGTEKWGKMFHRYWIRALPLVGMCCLRILQFRPTCRHSLAVNAFIMSRTTGSLPSLFWFLVSPRRSVFSRVSKWCALQVVIIGDDQSAAE